MPMDTITYGVRITEQTLAVEDSLNTRKYDIASSVASAVASAVLNHQDDS